MVEVVADANRRMVVVVVAVNAADVKKKERRKKKKKLTRCGCVGGRQRERTNGCGSGHLRVRRGWMVVVLAVDPADVRKIERKVFTYASGWQSTRTDERWWWCCQN